MLLALRKVARFYGPRLIFKDASLIVEPGTITLLTGPNGAGKTTLLKIMAGLMPPSAGSVLLGKEQDYPPAIGYLGHQTFLYPDLSALENLRFWSALHGLDLEEQDYAAMLERVELEDFAEEKSGCFSRGMAQRLNLARLFLLQPDLILLDEPGTGLDARSTGILHREINDARARGAGIVWITHNLAEDLDRADAVAALEGRTLHCYTSAAAYRQAYPASDKPARATGGSGI